MRFLKVLVLVPLVTLAACDQKKSDTAGAGARIAGPVTRDMQVNPARRHVCPYGRSTYVGRCVPGL